MTLIRYNPLADFVPSTFGDLIENRLRESQRVDFIPAVDIIQGEKTIELHLAAPGMSKKEFNINLEEDRLVISGERKEPENTSFLKQETNFGSFSRTFRINEDINTEDIKAEYKNGILKVVLPVKEKKVNKATIQVK
ncbi:MAG: Hsp20/alpha crystallin family protein [Fulvivirga sp.]|nr:Hsp20/alpha crystallin family protein [Fulvivirga sp.]